MACQCARVVLVTACLAAGAACGAPETVSLDAAAAEYLALAQALARHDPDFLDRPAPDGRQPILDLPAIAAAAARVKHSIGGAGPEDRRAFLAAQLAALERRARFVSGDRGSIGNEARALGLEVPRADRERAGALRAKLDAALPGAGPLDRRLAEYRRSSAVPRSRLAQVADEAADTCRTRSGALGEAAAGRVEFRYVLDLPWTAYTTYAGSGTSIVELRRDAALGEDDWLALVCHETWPGHHAQYLIWDNLREARGWAELSIAPRFTPHGVMAERAAAAATALAVPPASRAPVSVALDGLAAIALAVAVDRVDGRLDAAAAGATLRDELLMPDPDAFLAFVERYRSMAVAYVTPLEGLRDWSDYLDLLRSPDRLVAGAAR